MASIAQIENGLTISVGIQPGTVVGQNIKACIVIYFNSCRIRSGIQNKSHDKNCLEAS